MKINLLNIHFYLIYDNPVQKFGIVQRYCFESTKSFGATQKITADKYKNETANAKQYGIASTSL